MFRTGAAVTIHRLLHNLVIPLLPYQYWLSYRYLVRFPPFCAYLLLLSFTVVWYLREAELLVYFAAPQRFKALRFCHHRRFFCPVARDQKCVMITPSARTLRRWRGVGLPDRWRELVLGAAAVR